MKDSGSQTRQSGIQSGSLGALVLPPDGLHSAWDSSFMRCFRCHAPRVVLSPSLDRKSGGPQGLRIALDAAIRDVASQSQSQSKRFPLHHPWASWEDCLPAEALSASLRLDWPQRPTALSRFASGPARRRPCDIRSSSSRGDAIRLVPCWRSPRLLRASPRIPASWGSPCSRSPEGRPAREATTSRPRPMGEIRLVHRLFEDPTRQSGIRDYQEEGSFNRIHWRNRAIGTTQSRTYEPPSRPARRSPDFHQESLVGDGSLSERNWPAQRRPWPARSINWEARSGFFSNGRDTVDRIRSRRDGTRISNPPASSVSGQGLAVRPATASDRLGSKPGGTGSTFEQILRCPARLGTHRWFALPHPSVGGVEPSPAECLGDALSSTTSRKRPRSPLLGLSRRGYRVTAVHIAFDSREAPPGPPGRIGRRGSSVPASRSGEFTTRLPWGICYGTAGSLTHPPMPSPHRVPIRKSLGDYFAITLAPALIVILVGSLVLFRWRPFIMASKEAA